MTPIESFHMAPSLTREQAAIIGAFTGILCGPFEDLHQYIEKVMGRPVWTHEMGDRETMERIKELAKPDFMMLLPKGTRTENGVKP